MPLDFNKTLIDYIGKAPAAVSSVTGDEIDIDYQAIENFLLTIPFSDKKARVPVKYFLELVIEAHRQEPLVHEVLKAVGVKRLALLDWDRFFDAHEMTVYDVSIINSPEVWRPSFGRVKDWLSADRTNITALPPPLRILCASFRQKIQVRNTYCLPGDWMVSIHLPRATGLLINQSANLALAVDWFKQKLLQAVMSSKEFEGVAKILF